MNVHPIVLSSRLCPTICAIALVALPACDSFDKDENAADETPDEAPAEAEPESTPLDEPVPRARDEPMMRIDPGDAQSKPADHAVARLHPTEGNEATGTVRLTALADAPGLKVEADFENLPAGKHAFHVHLLGDCTAADGTSAGTHFNFKGSSESPPADIDRITGNLGEVEADETGKAHVEVEIGDARLQGPYAIVGRSVILHAKANDPASPPIGAAGGRIACGVIGVTRP